MKEEEANEYEEREMERMEDDWSRILGYHISMDMLYDTIRMRGTGRIGTRRVYLPAGRMLSDRKDSPEGESMKAKRSWYPFEKMFKKVKMNE